VARKQRYQLPSTTNIEMVAIKGNQVFKKLIKAYEISTVKKKKGFKYYFFQEGFSQFKNAIEK